MADKEKKNSNMHLYWGSGSPPCWRAMIVLAEKGLWEGLSNTLIEFSKKQHKEGKILELNPRGQVPTFYDGDIIVNESGAICMYLEENYTEKTNRLLPEDPGKRAQVYQRMFESANLQSNVIEKIVYYHMMTKKEDWNEELLKVNTEKAKEELKRWNTILEKSGGDYLCGKDFTMADAFFYPGLAFLYRSGAELTDVPLLLKYYKLVSERPSVKETWPPHWENSKRQEMLKDL